MKKRIISIVLCVVFIFGCIITAAAAEEKKNYLVLGDSIAYGSGLSNPREAVYGKIVADTNGYAYENYAVPGHTTDNLLRRMENETVRNAIAAADIINISIGGNNFLLGNINGLLYDGIVTKDYARFEEIGAGFYEDLGRIFDEIRALNPETAIVLQTLYNPQTGYVGEVYRKGGEIINAKILEFAENHPGEVLVADVGNALTDSDRDFAEDRIHPSAAGNEKIACVVLETLFENGLGTETTPVIETKGQDARGAGIFTVFVNMYGYFFHIIAVIRDFFVSKF